VDPAGISDPRSPPYNAHADKPESCTVGRRMGKSRGAEAKLARLRSLRKESVCPAIVAELRKFLGDSSNLVAAEAAAIIGDANLADLAPEMTAAFDRFMVDPGVADKLCR